MDDPRVCLPRQAHPIARARWHGAFATGGGVEPTDWDDGTQTACTGLYGWPSDQCQPACTGPFCMPTYETTSRW